MQELNDLYSLPNIVRVVKWPLDIRSFICKTTLNRNCRKQIFCVQTFFLLGTLEVINQKRFFFFGSDEREISCLTLLRTSCYFAVSGSGHHRNGMLKQACYPTLKHVSGNISSHVAVLCIIMLYHDTHIATCIILDGS